MKQEKQSETGETMLNRRSKVKHKKYTETDLLPPRRNIRSRCPKRKHCWNPDCPWKRSLQGPCPETRRCLRSDNVYM